MSLQSVLPIVKASLSSSKWTIDDDEVVPRPRQKLNLLPRYPHRLDFVPTTQAHFLDGGAYPEIQMVQYPLAMGRDRAGTTLTETLPLTVDKDGKIKYEMVKLR
jgi:SNW domain-containing protein 1